MRVAGTDLQHNRMLGGIPRSQNFASGGSMKQMLGDELGRHKEAKEMRLMTF